MRTTGPILCILLASVTLGSAPAMAQSPPDHIAWFEFSGQALLDVLDFQTATQSGAPILFRQTGGTQLPAPHEDDVDVQWSLSSARFSFIAWSADLEPGETAAALEMEADLHVRILSESHEYTWEGVMRAPLQVTVNAPSQDDDGNPVPASLGVAPVPLAPVEFQMEETSFPYPFLVPELEDFFQYAVGYSVGSWFDGEGDLVGEADFDFLSGGIVLGLAAVPAQTVPLPTPPSAELDPDARWVLSLRGPGVAFLDLPTLALVYTSTDPEDLPSYAPGVPYWATPGEASVQFQVPAEVMEAELEKQAITNAAAILNSESVWPAIYQLGQAGVPIFAKLGAAIYTPGSTEVIGVGTDWSGSAAPGFRVNGLGVPWTDGVHIAEVIDDTHLILDQPWPGQQADTETGSYFRAMHPPTVELFEEEWTSAAWLTLLSDEFAFGMSTDVLLSTCDIDVDVDLDLSIVAALEVDVAAEWIRADAQAYPYLHAPYPSVDCSDLITEAIVSGEAPDMIGEVLDTVATQLYQAELPLEGQVERQVAAILSSFAVGGTDFVPQELLMNQATGLAVVGRLVPVRWATLGAVSGTFDCDDPTICGQSEVMMGWPLGAGSSDLMAVDVTSYELPMFPQSTVGPAWEDWHVTVSGAGGIDAVAADGGESVSELAWSGDFEVDDDFGLPGPFVLTPGDLFAVGERLYLFQSVTQNGHAWGDPRYHFKMVREQQPLATATIWESLDIDADATATETGEYVGTATILVPGPYGSVAGALVEPFDAEVYEITASYDLQLGAFNGNVHDVRWYWDGTEMDGATFEVDADGVYSSETHELTIELDLGFPGGAEMTMTRSEPVSLAGVVWGSEVSSGSTGPIGPEPDSSGLDPWAIYEMPWDPRVGDPSPRFDPRDRRASTPRGR